MKILSVTNNNDVMSGSIIIEDDDDFFVYDNDTKKVREISMPDQVYRFVPYFEKFSGEISKTDYEDIERMVSLYRSDLDNLEDHAEFVEIRKSYGV